MSRAVANSFTNFFSSSSSSSSPHHSPAVTSSPRATHSSLSSDVPLSPVIPLSPSPTIITPSEKPSEKEAIIIDEALKEKQQLAREKLEKQKILVKDMSIRIMNKERNEGENAVRDDKIKLEELTQNMMELDDALKLSAEFEVARENARERREERERERSERKLERRERSLLDSLRKNSFSPPSLRGSGGRMKSSFNDLPILDGDEADLLNNSLTHLEDLAPPLSTSPLIRTAQAHAHAHAHAQAQAQALAQAQADEIATLTARVGVLEVEVEHERKVSEVLRANNSLLEKEVKRLEAEIDREKWERERYQREEKWKERLLEIEKLFLQQQLSKAQKAHDEEEKSELNTSVDEVRGEKNKEEKEEKEDEREKQLNDRVKLAQSLLNDVENDIRSTKLLKQQLYTEMMESKLKKRQQLLKRIQDQLETKKLNHSTSQNAEEEEELDGYESEEEEETSPDEKPSASTPNTNKAKRKSVAQLDMLVGKLEKLDKLDELLSKIESIKPNVVSSGEVGESSSSSSGGNSASSSSGVTRSPALDMKTELEELQKIIIDDSGKYTDKERADANIKYEKTFQIYQRTDEYRKDLANILEERRKRNEPLNKEALARVLDIYSPDNLKNSPELKLKLVKAPELNLIFMDPKAILAKHQNDFQQYQLNKLDLDELRAVRACLPKFRNDQTKQIDWVENLELKIEIYAKNPPPEKDMVRKAASKFKRPKSSKPTNPGDFLVELLQRFKNKPAEEEDASAKRGSRRNTITFRSPIRIRSFSKSDPSE